eukprot:16431295-Heterocapsa_arctica.AAC.1
MVVAWGFPEARRSLAQSSSCAHRSVLLPRRPGAKIGQPFKSSTLGTLGASAAVFVCPHQHLAVLSRSPLAASL